MLSEQCFTEMYSEIGHTTWRIFLKIFVQDCRFCHYLFSLHNGSAYNLRSSAAPLLSVPKEAETFQHSTAAVFYLYKLHTALIRNNFTGSQQMLLQCM